METISVRLEKVRDLDFIGKILNEKRSELIRLLLFKGREMQAMELYKNGKVSLGLGARLAGLTLSDFMDLLKKYNVQLNLEIEDAKDAMRYAEENL